MQEEKQQLLLEYLISSPDVYVICQHIIEPEYFGPKLVGAVAFIKKYYGDHSSMPSVEQVLVEGGVLLTLRDVTDDVREYCANEIERFCRHAGMTAAILKSVELIDKGRIDDVMSVVSDAVLISLNHDMGLSYYDNVRERLDAMLVGQTTISTGWPSVDEALFGGLSRKELFLVAANSGGGKSITLANLALNFSDQNMEVLYLSLELAPEIVSQRFDTMITGISRKDWKDHIDEIVETIECKREGCGKITVIQMTSQTKANQIRAYLKEYQLLNKRVPDMLVVDYLDKMAPNEHVDANNAFGKDKLCSEQLRDIGVDLNMVVATASQLNRSAVGNFEHDHSQIAGGISKIHESDVYMSIIMTSEMKAVGDATFIFQKTRNSDGDGKAVNMQWDSKYLRLRDRVADAGLTFNATPKSDSSAFGKNNPNDLFGICSNIADK